MYILGGVGLRLRARQGLHRVCRFTYSHNNLHQSRFCLTIWLSPFRVWCWVLEGRKKPDFLPHVFDHRFLPRVLNVDSCWVLDQLRIGNLILIPETAHIAPKLAKP